MADSESEEEFDEASDQPNNLKMENKNTGDVRALLNISIQLPILIQNSDEEDAGVSWINEFDTVGVFSILEKAIRLNAPQTKYAVIGIAVAVSTIVLNRLVSIGVPASDYRALNQVVTIPLLSGLLIGVAAAILVARYVDRED